MPGELLVDKPSSDGVGGDKVVGDEGSMKIDTTEDTKSSSTADDSGAKSDVPASKAVVGIIYPPPEVRNIVDKTADFVARNGPEFEDRIRMNEAGNTKFNFLSPVDPYHAYYRHKINEIKEGVAQEEAAPPIPPLMQQVVSMVPEIETPTAPPAEWEYSAEPPSISALELDIVKLTAQFVARNGAQFLDKLMMREQRNYQFDFLRKQHPLFNYFTKLVEQYSRILLPSKDLKNKLVMDVERPASILERSHQRYLWEQFQQKQRRKVEEEEEKERIEYAQIDWHGFVIVETINFRESEAGYLPPPIRPSQLAHRLMQQQKYERLVDEGGEVEEIEMEVEPNEPDSAPEPPAPKDKEEAPPSPPKAPPPQAPPQPGQAVIRHGYNPKAGHAAPNPSQTQQGSATKFLISPITGEKIPADKMEEHMKYSLLDPRWREEQKKQIDEKRTQDLVFAEGMQIGTHLKSLAERRTDIFGAEETIIGHKIGEEQRKKKKAPTVQWDGHSGSSDIVTRQAQANIPDQLEIIQKAKEQAEKEQLGPRLPTVTSQPKPPLLSVITHPPRPLFQGGPQPLPQEPRGLPPGMVRLPNSAPPVPGMPPRPMGPPGMALPAPPQIPLFPSHPSMPRPPGAPPPHMMGMPPGSDMGIPVAKRPRAETDDLIPEQEFVSSHPGPVTFQVQVPAVTDRPEWKLSGQIITITLPITDSVSVIKAKISEELGMPSGKQKLQIGTIFIKDSNSLGFYNFTNTTLVTLGLKERGGRKK